MKSSKIKEYEAMFGDKPLIIDDSLVAKIEDNKDKTTPEEKKINTDFSGLPLGALLDC